MKKVLSLILAFLMLLLVLCSCNETPQNKKEEESTTSEPFTDVDLKEATDYSSTTNSDYSYADICARLYDTAYASMKPKQGEKSYEFSSCDTDSYYDEETDTYVNWAANVDSRRTLGQQKDGGYVLADIEGCGYTTRIWLPNDMHNKMKFYVDGELLFDTTWLQFAEDIFADYDELAYCLPYTSHNVFVPITFNESLKIVWYDGDRICDLLYYEIAYTLLPTGSTVEPFTNSASQKEELAKANAKIKEAGTTPENPTKMVETTVEAGKSITLYESRKTGAIDYFSLDIDIPTSEYDKNTSYVDWMLEFYWDGSDVPSINIPVCDFFASSCSLNTWQSIALGVKEDGTMWSEFYMPYNSCKVILTNNSSTARNIKAIFDAEEVNNIENYCRFAVNWQYMTDQADDEIFPDSNILSVSGCGRFVGMALNLYQNGSLWWGEGDEKFFIDGEKYPSWFGTGSEDYFGYAWGNAQLFESAYSCQTEAGSLDEEGNHIDCSTGNYQLLRIQLLDNIPFTSSFEGYLEKYFCQYYVRCASTTYFYINGCYEAQAPNITLRKTYPTADYTGYTDLLEPKLVYHGRELPARIITISNTDHYMQDVGSVGGEVYSTGGQFFWRSNKNDTMELELDIPEDGTYDLYIRSSYASDYGKIEIEIDDTIVCEGMDAYSSVVKLMWSKEGENITLTKGKHIVRIKVVGKNTKSSGYFVGLDTISFVNVNNPEDIPQGKTAEDETSYHEPAVTTPQLTYIGYDLYNRITSGDNYCMQAPGDVGGESYSPNGGQLFWCAGGGDKLTFKFYIPTEGDYTIKIRSSYASDYGVLQIKIDDEVVVASMDTYSSTVLLKWSEEGTVHLTAGEHTMEWMPINKNPSSRGYYIGIDTLKFEAIK